MHYTHTHTLYTHNMCRNTQHTCANCILYHFPTTSFSHLLSALLRFHNTPAHPTPLALHLHFFFLMGPFVLTRVVTWSTSGSSVFSTLIVRISRFLGSHLRAICPQSAIVLLIRYLLRLDGWRRGMEEWFACWLPAANPSFESSDRSAFQRSMVVQYAIGCHL